MTDAGTPCFSMALLNSLGRVEVLAGSNINK